MNDSDKLEDKRKRLARWRILKTLDAGRPSTVPDILLVGVVQDIDDRITELGIKRALQYLEEKGLVKIGTIFDPGEGEHQEYSLTSLGIDYVDYTTPDDPGIARPRRI